MLWCFVLLATLSTIQGRAVNISNTWVLPEEGFPVFYRYFRDRISWYEADAVCQFHHANLVTVDTTSQYDAVRAYLKELDITSAVWVGLIRSNTDGDFTWTDYRGLSGDGYWSSAPDTRDAPLCAAADPAADYRWEARACGGPTVASFICELPVPQWALGAEGCMVRSLPAVTILYLPESASVQLTTDCGLVGVKRVICNGNMKREDIVKHLSCIDIAEDTDVVNTSNTMWLNSTQTLAVEQENIKELNTTEDLSSEDYEKTTILTSIVTDTASYYDTKIKMSLNYDKDQKLNYDIYNNNLQSNDIPKIANEDDSLLSDKLDKLEDEQHLQHKIMHDELARRGNFETIFTQPTDHFIPPLVMAKSRISDDMTVLSLEEKHAQQLVEERLEMERKNNNEENANSNNESKTTDTKPVVTTDQVLTFIPKTLSKQVKYKEQNDTNTKNYKNGIPKKYLPKYSDAKHKLTKILDGKSILPNDQLDNKLQTENLSLLSNSTYSRLMGDDPSIDLKVIITDTDDVTETSIHKTVTQKTSVDVPEENNEQITTEGGQLVHFTKQSTASKFMSASPVTTLLDTITSITPRDIPLLNKSSSVEIDNMNVHTTPKINSEDLHTDNPLLVTRENNDEYIKSKPTIIEKDLQTKEPSITEIEEQVTVEAVTEISFKETQTKNVILELNSNATFLDHLVTESNIGTNNDTSDVSTETVVTELTEQATIDDFQSPLLSGANDPVPKPMRKQIPSQNKNKFNPFRILG